MGERTTEPTTEREGLTQTRVSYTQLAIRFKALLTERDAALSPKPESYACQMCGRRDGLDAAVTDEVWKQLTGRTNGLLCLWCMDKLATEKGVAAFVHLYFNGYSLVGSEGPTIWDESELTKQLLASETRCVRLVAERRAALEALVETNTTGTCDHCHRPIVSYGKGRGPHPRNPDHEPGAYCACTTRRGCVHRTFRDCPVCALLAQHGKAEEAG